MDTEKFLSDEFIRYLIGIKRGQPVVDALLKIDDPLVIKPVLCASIDTWCKKYGVDPIELVTEMLDAIVSVHEKDGEDEE